MEKNEVIILNKPFLGGWLDHRGNIGHEIIDYLFTDDGDYYVYNNPWGVCPDDIWIEGTTDFQRKPNEKYNCKYLLLTSEKHGDNFSILFVIELAEKLHRLHRPNDPKQLEENQKVIRQIIQERHITYSGKYLYEIYPNDDSLYLTFRGKRIYKAETPISVDLNYNFQRNKGYIYSDRDSDDYKELKEIIEKNISEHKLKEFQPQNVRNDPLKQAETKKTFLDLIALETNEQVFTNILYSLLSYKDMLCRFCNRFRGNREFDTRSEYKVFREAKVVAGRMDVCAENDSQRIIIENKVYSGLNGIKPADNKTQLSTYYDWAQEKKKLPLCFITAPDFRTDEIAREIKEKDAGAIGNYKIITYREIADFIKDELQQGGIGEDYEYYSLVEQIIYAFKNLSYKKEELYARMFLNATNKTGEAAYAVL